MNSTIRDRIAKWVAYRLPARVVYFCGVRLWEYATDGKFSEHHGSAVSVDDALWMWEDYGFEEAFGAEAHVREQIRANDALVMGVK